MAKQFVLYNLKEGRTEEDFLKWVNEFKGPFITGLPGVKRYTLTSVKRAVQFQGGPPGPIDPPYKLAAVVDLTSLEDYAKDTAGQPYQDFTAKFSTWVTGFLILQGVEIYDEESR